MPRAYSPGRVNLIGDHTDYNDGLALPMAVDLGTTVTFMPEAGTRVRLVSTTEAHAAEIDIPVPMDPEKLQAIRPRWARHAAAVIALMRPLNGGHGTVESTLPIGAGLSSSTALEVALYLAFGGEGEPQAVAIACHRAEQMATGVPSGLMDQLTMTSAIEGCALLVDFGDLAVRHVRIPEAAEIVVVHSGQSRTVDGSPYAARRAECEAAAYGSGPLGQLPSEDLVGIADPVLRRRARHVVSECERVRACAAALERADLAEAGRLMTASHRSLAHDFEVSAPALDDLVEELLKVRGVFGARLTGAGFGGCVVALTEPGAIDVSSFASGAWVVRASGPASVVADS
jgi:galactokinase